MGVNLKEAVPHWIHFSQGIGLFGTIHHIPEGYEWADGVDICAWSSQVIHSVQWVITASKALMDFVHLAFPQSNLQ